VELVTNQQLGSVSTIIPAFNAERTIALAIDSALSQDFENHEVVVVNDGSTDATPWIVGRYGSRIRVVNQKNGGLSAARNTGIAQSKGKYLAFLDSDDIWLPGKLRILTAALERAPGAALAFSEYGFIDEIGAEYRRSAIGDEPKMQELITRRPFPLFQFKDAILPSSWVVPRIILERSGGFCEAFKGAGGFDDFWMLLLLADLGEFVYIRDKLMLYRAFTGEFADKYGLGVAIFKSLVRTRYGRRLGKDIIRGVTETFCSWLVVKAAHQISHGDRNGAMRSLLNVAQLRPTYFLSVEFAGRLFRRRDRKRGREFGTLRNQNIS
jgi:glycosyltransferase involved in cell wall biosynthesis